MFAALTFGLWAYVNRPTPERALAGAACKAWRSAVPSGPGSDRPGATHRAADRRRPAIVVRQGYGRSPASPLKSLSRIPEIAARPYEGDGGRLAGSRKLADQATTRKSPAPSSWPINTANVIQPDHSRRPMNRTILRGDLSVTAVNEASSITQPPPQRLTQSPYRHRRTVAREPRSSISRASGQHIKLAYRRPHTAILGKRPRWTAPSWHIDARTDDLQRFAPGLSPSLSPKSAAPLPRWALRRRWWRRPPTKRCFTAAFSGARKDERLRICPAPMEAFRSAFPWKGALSKARPEMREAY